jgi:hypothetical protein
VTRLRFPLAKISGCADQRAVGECTEQECLLSRRRQPFGDGSGGLCAGFVCRFAERVGLALELRHARAEEHVRVGRREHADNDGVRHGGMVMSRN